MTIRLRVATRDDIALIAHFIRALADYEKLLDEVRLDEGVLAEKLFGPRPYAEVLIGEINGQPEGFALFFHNFSTSEGRPGIYLEDLFVTPEARGSGAGQALYKTLEDWAQENGAAALFMIALDDDRVEKTSKFYARAGFKPMERTFIKGFDAWQ